MASSKSTNMTWLPTLAMAVAIAGALGGPAVTYGIMQNRIATVERDLVDLDKEFARTKTVLHQRISVAQAEISGLKTSALERVTDVEVKITRLDSKLDGYSREAQAAASAQQATMASILKRLQGDLSR